MWELWNYVARTFQFIKLCKGVTNLWPQTSIRRSVSGDVLQSLVVALVFYGSATLAGLPKQLMDRLQSVQNTAAWLIFRARRYDHVQPLLWILHWLRVPERISFQLAVLVYCCLHGSAPGYLASDLQRVSDLGARRRLRQRLSLHAPSAAASVWNSLPETVHSSPSLPEKKTKNRNRPISMRNR